MRFVTDLLRYTDKSYVRQESERNMYAEQV
jgi:hypothetical protein